MENQNLALGTRALAMRGATVADHCRAAHALEFRAIAVAAIDGNARKGDLNALDPKERLEVVAVRAGCIEPRGADAAARPAVEELAARDAGRAARAMKSLADHAAFARSLGCERIVVHGGAVDLAGLDERLRHAEGLIERGESAGELLEEVRRLSADRRAEPLERLCRALHALCRAHGEQTFALLPAAKPHDLLSLAALRDVLDDLKLPNLGVWIDVGRLRAAENFGCDPLSLVLPALAARVTGADLHDARGLHEHLPPGQGEVDWKLVAETLPRAAARVLDLEVGTRAAEIRTARAALRQLGLA